MLVQVCNLNLNSLAMWPKGGLTPTAYLAGKKSDLMKPKGGFGLVSQTSCLLVSTPAL